MTKDNITAPDLKSYDNIIVAFSGGKDSLACLLNLIDAGVPTNKIEIWHHDVDGHSGHFMDWTVTADYCRKVAQTFGIKIYFSWKVGGFEREMLRENSKTAPTAFQTPEGEVHQVGGIIGKGSTRMMFPQVTANLSVRWCSAYLKIDVCTAAIRNQKRFNNKKTLIVTGERAEESASRAKYKSFEPHKSDNRDGRTGRHVDQWRPVHGWTEEKVWDIIRHHKVNPHPAYKLGWGRVSCAACIFGSKDQWASLFKINRPQVEKIMNYEKLFGKTINRTKSVGDLVLEGHPYESMHQTDIDQALNKKYSEDIITENWSLPAGAFGESCGPV